MISPPFPMEVPYSEIESELSVCTDNIYYSSELVLHTYDNSSETSSSGKDSWSEKDHINFINAITYFADSGLQMDIWFDLQKILPIPADYPINKTKEYRLWKKRV